MPENSDATKTEIVTSEAARPNPIKKMTVGDFTDRLLERILADCGVTFEQVADATEPEKRQGYNMTVIPKDAIPMPTPDEEAALMVKNAGLNREGISTKEILDALKAK